MKTKLLPCPFCGGEAEYSQFVNPRNFYRVVCTTCHCGTDGFRGIKDGTPEENKDEQATIWNRREGKNV